MKNAVTITMIFKASALNRDEKAGGNILTIKKLKRGDGKVYPYISRPAMRHYLWYTLWKKNRDRWGPAEVRLAQNDVIQFDLRKGNAIAKAELDLFGYMVTISGQNSITRKAPLGITKAEGLEPWEGDMAFYSNHDLVRRGREQGLNADPNLYNKEEFLGFFKVSFTLDLERIGVEELPYPKENEPKKENGNWVIVYREESIGLPKGMEKEGVDGKWTDKNKKKILWKNGNELYAKGEDVERYFDPESSTIRFTKNGKQIPVIGKEEIEGEERFKLDVEEFDESSKKLIIRKFTKIPSDLLERQPEDVKFTMKRFSLKESEKICRIQDVLEALRGGLIYHSSTENYGITPLFFAAAIVDVPIPVLHNYVVVKNIGRDTFEIDKDVFRKAAENPWVEKIYVESAFDENLTGGNGFEDNWKKFLAEVLGETWPEEEKEEPSEQEETESQEITEMKEEKEEPSEEVEAEEEREKEMPRGEEFVEQKELIDEEKGEASEEVEAEEEKEEEAPEGEEVIEKKERIGTKAEVQLLKGGVIRILYKDKEIYSGSIEEAKDLTDDVLKKKIKEQVEGTRLKPKTLEEIRKKIQEFNEK